MRTNHLWRVDFVLYPGFDVSPVAKQAFERKIDKYVWIITQEGNLVSFKSDSPLIYLMIDLEDKRTLASFNVLPALFSGNLSASNRERWRMNVYDKNDQGWKDSILIDAGGNWYLDGMSRAWRHLVDNFDNLGREVKKIQDKLT